MIELQDRACPDCGTMTTNTTGELRVNGLLIRVTRSGCLKCGRTETSVWMEDVPIYNRVWKD